MKKIYLKNQLGDLEDYFMELIKSVAETIEDIKELKNGKLKDYYQNTQIRLYVVMKEL